MDSAALFLVIGVLVFGLQLGAATAVIHLWRLYRPADPVSLLSLLGPPALTMAASVGIALIPALLRFATMLDGFAHEGVTEGLKVGSIGLAIALVSAAWAGAWAYLVIGLGFSITARGRAEAPWLLKSVGLTGLGLALVSAAGLAFMIVGFRSFSTGDEVPHGP